MAAGSTGPLSATTLAGVTQVSAGIIEALTRPRVVRGPGEARAGRLDLSLVRALSRALEQAGIRPSQRSRRVGDYELGAPLFQGPGYQDWEATHVALKGVRRRVRLYSVAPGAGAAARGTIRGAAEREFRILEGIQHAGILRAVDYTEHERGQSCTEPTEIWSDPSFAGGVAERAIGNRGPGASCR